MKSFLKYGTLALLVGAGLNVAAQADDATTRGGITIKSADGNFDANLGGRIQLDGYLDSTDHNGAKIGSAAPGDSASNFQFRRVWLSLKGDLYSFQYHIDYDFVSGGLYQAWFSHDLLPGGTPLRRPAPALGQAWTTSPATPTRRSWNAIPPPTAASIPR